MELLLSRILSAVSSVVLEFFYFYFYYFNLFLLTVTLDFSSEGTDSNIANSSLQIIVVSLENILNIIYNFK